MTEQLHFTHLIYLGKWLWCFRNAVLESPWDSKEIKPVNPKGNQSWLFIGRIDKNMATAAKLLSCPTTGFVTLEELLDYCVP